MATESGHGQINKHISGACFLTTTHDKHMRLLTRVCGRLYTGYEEPAELFRNKTSFTEQQQTVMAADAFTLVN